MSRSAWTASATSTKLVLSSRGLARFQVAINALLQCRLNALHTAIQLVPDEEPALQHLWQNAHRAESAS